VVMAAPASAAPGRGQRSADGHGVHHADGGRQGVGFSVADPQSGKSCKEWDVTIQCLTGQRK
jgi:hypothetical protein